MTEGNGAQVAMTATQAAAAAPAKPPKQSETVEMSDNRKVEFSGTWDKGQKIQKEVLVDGKPWGDLTDEEKAKAHIGSAAIRIDFRNGTTRLYPLNPALALQYAVHGALQKYGDELAGEQASDLDDWAATTDRLHERIMAGEWRRAREGGGMAGTSVLLQALMEFTGRTADEVRAHIKDWTPQQKIALRNDPELKPIVERIEAEKAAKVGAKIDTGALKASLRGLAA